MKTVWKRLSALVLALTMVLSLLSAGAWAWDPALLTITVGDTSAKKGDYVRVPVTVSNNPGIAGLALEFTLPAGVTLVPAESERYGIDGPNPLVNVDDGIFGENSVLLPNNGDTTVSLLNGENVTANGKLLELNVIAPNTPGTYEISVKCKDGKASNICDEDGNTVAAVFVAGTLTVQDAEHVHDAALTHVTRKEATAIEDGNIEYWRCTGCGKCFSDANGTTEITDLQTIVVPKTRQDCDEDKHIWQVDKRIEPQVRIEGAIEKHCTVCGKKETEVIRALPSRLLGDVTGDDLVDIDDLQTMYQYLQGRKGLELSEDALAVANVSGDYLFDIDDVQTMYQYLQGRKGVQLLQPGQAVT